jgi:hypothetical protein
LFHPNEIQKKLLKGKHMFEENGLSSWVILACALAALYWGPMLWQRLQLSLAKHPSMAGHLRWA